MKHILIDVWLVNSTISSYNFSSVMCYLFTENLVLLKIYGSINIKDQLKEVEGLQHALVHAHPDAHAQQCTAAQLKHTKRRG